MRERGPARDPEENLSLKSRSPPFPPQSNNSTPLTVGVVGVLILFGIWLFVTPPNQVGTQVASTVTTAEVEEPAYSAPAKSSKKVVEEEKEEIETETSSTSKEVAEELASSELSKEADSSSEIKSQDRESKEEKETETTSSSSSSDDDDDSSQSSGKKVSFPLCTERKDDNIPCLDNTKAIKALKSTKHYEHRERHCPEKGELEKCLLPLPEGYKPHVNWPESRDQIWYNNVPKPALANYKADQNWVKAEGDKFVFPGGGTQFKFGATKYIEWLQEACPELTWGEHIRVMLDMGCGVASFGAYLDPFDVRVMSVAPKDEHDAQIQFALERGVSAMVGVMGTQRQPYAANIFDAVHCARCRVPWHADGGRLLLELNRLIRPGGYFVWSATPVCPECKAMEPDDKEVWEAMTKLTKAICWKRITKKINEAFGIGVAVWQKPTDNECYEEREKDAEPPLCDEDDNPDAAWYVPMQSCLHKVPTSSKQHGFKYPPDGKQRLTKAPEFLKAMKKGVFGEPAYDEFKLDVENWKRISKTYLKDMGIDWATIRNIIDMDAHYGGFGAALAEKPAWSMNVVPTTAPDTLPVVFERGLLGVYHDWCESLNTYPRTYDLIHADHILGKEIKAARCDIEDIMLEMDRILRPTGYVIVRESSKYFKQVEAIAKALHWEEKKAFKDDKDNVVAYQKTLWRPKAEA